MRKKTQDFSQNFKMPHLFREDLESIENTIKELSPREYKFETKDFEYKTIQEIPGDINAVNDFHIQTYDPYIGLDFSKSNARIYSSDDNIKVIGVVKKIADVVSKRERRFFWYISKLACWFAPAFFFIPFSLILIMFFNHVFYKGLISKALVFISGLVPLLAAIWWIAGYRLDFYNFSLIEFAYRKNKSNLFIRNKDQIIVGIIVAIITVVLTLLFQKIFK